MRRRFDGLMSLQFPAIAGGDVYLLNDSFNDTRIAGSVDGTPATPGPGTRDATEIDGQLSIGSGVLNVPPQTTPVWGDLGLRYLETFERNVGAILLAKYNPSVNLKTATPIAWKEDANVNTTAAGGNRHIFTFQDTNNRILIASGTDTALVKAFWVFNTDYFTAIVLRSSGAYFFIKGGAFTNWTLLWHDSIDNSDPMYAVTSNYDQTYPLDNFRIPKQTWLPTPPIYDTFIDDNGTSLDAHVSDVIGPDGQAVASRSWTEVQGDWDIQSNEANLTGGAPAEALKWLATTDLGEADVVADVDVIFDATATNAGGILLRYSSGPDGWTVHVNTTTNTITIDEWDDDAKTNRASVGVTIDPNNTYAVRAIADGQTIDGFVDGGNRVTYGSAALNETVTVHGLRGYASGVTFDNFLVFPRTEGAGGGYSTLDKFIG